MDDKGVFNLGEPLENKKLYHLQQLNLSHNHISVEGIEAIFSSITCDTCPYFHTVLLRDNCLKDEGFDQLINLLYKNNNHLVQKIDVAANELKLLRRCNEIFNKDHIPNLLHINFDGI